MIRMRLEMEGLPVRVKLPLRAVFIESLGGLALRMEWEGRWARLPASLLSHDHPFHLNERQIIRCKFLRDHVVPGRGNGRLAGSSRTRTTAAVSPYPRRDEGGRTNSH